MGLAAPSHVCLQLRSKFMYAAQVSSTCVSLCRLRYIYSKLEVNIVINVCRNKYLTFSIHYIFQFLMLES